MQDCSKPRRQSYKHPIRMLVFAVLATVLAASLCSCRDTLKLTEIVYDQSAEIVDYDTDLKLLVQDADAELTSNQLPLVNPEENTPKEETESEPLEGQDDLDREAPDEDLSQQTDDEFSTTPQGDDLAEGGAGEDEEGDAGNDADEGEDNGADGNVEDEDYSDGDTGDRSNLGGTTGARSGAGTLYYFTSGSYDEPPSGVDYVAAVGEAATIVSMLAGDTGALLYTDAEWAARENLQTVLSDKYNNDVVVAWSSDGASRDLTDEGLAAMIADERLECVFVISGDETLTDEQQKALEEAGIIVSVLPNLSTATNIKEAVVWIGQIFAKGDKQNKQALELAKAYVSFHDETLAEAASLASTSTTDKNGYPVFSSGTNYYTLYISDWADDVSYIGNDGLVGGLDTSYGIGICELGYRWSPLAYYLSVGGAINTASLSTESSGTSLVWQFNTNHISATEADFSRTGLVSSYMRNSGDTAYGWTYLTSSDFKGVGSEYFPYVIVSNQADAAKMEADKSQPDGVNSLYKIYGITQATSSNGATYYWSGPLGTETAGFVRYAVAGLVSAQQVDQSIQYLRQSWDSVDYGIVVNPHGLFESWTDGTVESFLETAWISSLYAGGSDPSKRIIDFYEEFYGYSLSDEEVQTILAGLPDN